MNSFYVIAVFYEKKGNAILFTKNKHKGPFETREEAQKLEYQLNETRNMNKKQYCYYEIGTESDFGKSGLIVL